MNTDEMPAGREMDGQIHTLVFNKKVPTDHNWMYDAFCDCVPRYSSDDTWGIAIVNTFRFGWRNHAAACIDTKISDWVGRSDCQVSIFGPDIAEVRAEAYSVCLAICRAALKAATQQEEN